MSSASGCNVLHTMSNLGQIGFVSAIDLLHIIEMHRRETLEYQQVDYLERLYNGCVQGFTFLGYAIS